MKAPFMLKAACLAVALSCATGVAHAIDTVTVDLGTVINTLTPATYGGGVEPTDDYVRQLFTTTTVSGHQNQPLHNAFKQLNAGLMRFPNGTLAHLYYWNYTCANYVFDWSTLDPNRHWTPNEVYRAMGGPGVSALNRPSFGTEKLVQINTRKAAFGRRPAGSTSWRDYQPGPCMTADRQGWQYNGALVAAGSDPWFDTYTTVKSTLSSTPVWAETSPYQDAQGMFDFREDGLAKIAEAAGEWLRANRRNIEWRAGAPVKNAAGDVAGYQDARIWTEQVDYWEIGNEDWAEWRPEAYGAKFVEIATRMNKVDRELAAAFPTQPRKPLKFVVQTIEGDWLTRFAAGVHERYGQCRQRETANPDVCVGLNGITALSLHPYLTADHDVDFKDRTGALFAKVDKLGQAVSGAIDETSAVIDTKNKIAQIKANQTYKVTVNWEIWATEYNVSENAVFAKAQNTNDAVLTEKVYTEYHNTLAHGAFMADVTARLLALGVSRVIPFGTNQHPNWALFHYDHGGSEFYKPRWAPAGFAFGKLIEKFQGNMVKTSVQSPSTLTANTVDQFTQAARSYSYGPLSAYSVADGSGGSLKVLLVNRDTVNSASIRLKIQNGWRVFTPDASFDAEELSGEPSTTNFVLDRILAATYANDLNALPQEPVRWGRPSWLGSSPKVSRTCLFDACTLANTLTVRPGSVLVVTLPLSPR